VVSEVAVDRGGGAFDGSRIDRYPHLAEEGHQLPPPRDA
jgi:hypothetical protein